MTHHFLDQCGPHRIQAMDRSDFILVPLDQIVSANEDRRSDEADGSDPMPQYGHAVMGEAEIWSLRLLD